MSISHTPTGNPALNQTWFANLAKLLFSWFIWSVAKTFPGHQLRPENSLFNRDMSFHGQDRIRIFIITNLSWCQRAFISTITGCGKMTPAKLCFRLLYAWHKQMAFVSPLLQWGQLIISQQWRKLIFHHYVKLLYFSAAPIVFALICVSA